MNTTAALETLRAAAAAAQLAVNDAAAAHAIACEQMQAAGCTPETIKAARRARTALAAAKAKATRADAALWFAENR
jgi:hypothetical protein